MTLVTGTFPLARTAHPPDCENEISENPSTVNGGAVAVAGTSPPPSIESCVFCQPWSSASNSTLRLSGLCAPRLVRAVRPTGIYRYWSVRYPGVPVVPFDRYRSPTPLNGDQPHR